MSDKRRCPIHGSYNDYFNEGCPECQLAETELKSEVAHTAYKSANPGDHECPHCRYISLKAGASRCPLCHGQVGVDYWNAEAERKEAEQAAAVLTRRDAETAKQAAAAADRAAYDRATWGLRGRHLAFAIVVAGLWWGLRQYTIWLPDAHPHFVGATLAVLSQYVGGVLGATIVCIGLALVMPRLPREVIAMLVFVFLCVVELGQLSRAHWIEDVRLTWLGGMVLGDGFRWSRLLCYAIGTLPLIDENDVVGFWRLLLTVLFSGACVALWQFGRAVWQT